jgi:hypothetical protein
MKFMDKFIRTVEGALQKKINKAPQDVDFVRQNSPPDERDAESVEADSVGENAVVLCDIGERRSDAGNN